MDELISRQAAIDIIDDIRACISVEGYWALMERWKKLPSAQPEIIRCKDCRWKQGAECVRFADVRPFPDDFCSRSERRTDERSD